MANTDGGRLLRRRSVCMRFLHRAGTGMTSVPERCAGAFGARFRDRKFRRTSAGPPITFSDKKATPA